MKLIEIPPGHVAEVVTYLDMREKPKPAPLPSAPLRLTRWQPVDLAKYRILFERVGAPWLWYSRLVMEDEALDAVINHADIRFYAVEDRRGIEVGMIELDFREAKQCEIQFFGLVPELAGKGYGRWLMMQTLALAWQPDIGRVHLHTCTLDHPNALAFYRKMGFVPRGRAIETFPDPRLAGILPHDCAPHVPILEG
ncbi:GNAT family N-acetyltransferase [Parasphingopyxis algicola]|uniref:GNAT family N-acetyltransferase n=1 Tax=Parasphingopyxis algicola TaxID=2026624 RepID=UPI00159F9226|nr:GNAT family N-acetyltransferase [Parasphingopyxis algicola]QLC24528.1 GNAT family N-acetyltransferase [Parasphingopyxis algicola]